VLSGPAPLDHGSRRGERREPPAESAGMVSWWGRGLAAARAREEQVVLGFCARWRRNRALLAFITAGIFVAVVPCLISFPPTSMLFSQI
jgi:hypothetical protein